MPKRKKESSGVVSNHRVPIGGREDAKDTSESEAS